MAPSNTTPEIWTAQTPDAWMAGSNTFPRIAVIGPTEADALALLDERRAWWMTIPDPVNSV